LAEWEIKKKSGERKSQDHSLTKIKKVGVCRTKYHLMGNRSKDESKGASDGSSQGGERYKKWQQIGGAGRGV